MARTPTQMWCPGCESIEPCESQDFDSVVHGRGRQLVMEAEHHEDLHYFRRRRVCTECGSEFFTVELDEKFMLELITLRGHVGGLQSLLPELNKVTRLIKRAGK